MPLILCYYESFGIKKGKWGKLETSPIKIACIIYASNSFKEKKGK